MSHDELEYSQVGQLQLFYSLDLFCSPQQHLSCCSSLGCQLGPVLLLSLSLSGTGTHNLIYNLLALSACLVICPKFKIKSSRVCSYLCAYKHAPTFDTYNGVGWGLGHATFFWSRVHKVDNLSNWSGCCSIKMSKILRPRRKSVGGGGRS